MEGKHVPRDSGPRTGSAVGELARRSGLFVCARALCVLWETLWNRAGGGFADVFTSNQLDFHGLSDQLRNSPGQAEQGIGGGAEWVPFRIVAHPGVPC